MLPFITIFGRELGMYAVMAVIGMLIAGFVFCKEIKKSGNDDNDAIIFLLIAALGILIGGSLLYAITNLRYVKLFAHAERFSDVVWILGKLFGGSVFYGGLIGACIAGLLFIRIAKLPLKVYMDRCALFAPLFHGFARIGCFFGGCCYGVESTFGFCAVGNTLTDIGEVCRFPVQLLESALNFAIALVIWILLSKQKLEGKLFYLYLSLYAAVRFSDEFLRGDAVRGFVFGLSTSQFISIWIELIALTALLVIPFCQRRNETRKNRL